MALHPKAVYLCLNWLQDEILHGILSLAKVYFYSNETDLSQANQYLWLTFNSSFFASSAYDFHCEASICIHFQFLYFWWMENCVYIYGGRVFLLTVSFFNKKPLNSLNLIYENPRVISQKLPWWNAAVNRILRKNYSGSKTCSISNLDQDYGYIIKKMRMTIKHLSFFLFGIF